MRGYLIGSGWKDYQKTGAVCGIALPKGLLLAAKLPEPIFTPATKAPKGQHDENIAFERDRRTPGRALAEKMRDISLKIYEFAAEYALERGIIIADTKFEFGVDKRGQLVPHRRSADAGFLALLAGGHLSAPASARPPSTSSTCAIIWRPWIGARSRRHRSCPRKSSPRPPRNTRKLING